MLLLLHVCSIVIHGFVRLNNKRLLKYRSSKLLYGAILRVVVALIVVFGSQFSLKEKTFIAMAWPPKITRQVSN